MKVVNRRYYSKKLGGYVTKQYTYNKTYVNKRGGASKLLVGKGGRVTKEYQRRLAEVMVGKDVFQKADIESIVEEAVTKGYKLSIRSLEARMATNRIETMIINTGFTKEQVADAIGVPVDALLDPENWNKDEFTFNGQTHVFEFNYQGQVWVR